MEWSETEKWIDAQKKVDAVRRSTSRMDVIDVCDWAHHWICVKMAELRGVTYEEAAPDLEKLAKIAALKDLLAKMEGREAGLSEGNAKPKVARSESQLRSEVSEPEVELEGKGDEPWKKLGISRRTWFRRRRGKEV
jgi:hypothetical protein